jgi:hypothetical protein
MDKGVFMKNIITRLIFGVLLANSTNVSFLNLDGSTSLLNPSPPIMQNIPIGPLQGSYIFLPIVMKPKDRYYAQAEHFESIIFGVWASIQTPNPAIREPYFSYASINIIAPDGKWIETGVRKMTPDCTPRFVYAKQPGGPVNVLLSPMPNIGVSYQYKIEKFTDGLWTLNIMLTNGTVIYSTYIDNPGMNYGTRIQVSGEVHSPNALNDLGISDVITLKWKLVNGNWSLWNGWARGVDDDPPYRVIGIAPDTNNNVRVSGNNGNPILPGAPCP